MEQGLRRAHWLLRGPILTTLTTLLLVGACAITWSTMYPMLAAEGLVSPTMPQFPFTSFYALATVDSAHVTRTEDQTTIMPPLDTTIKDTATAQALYNAALVLQVRPAGIINCPLGDDITYHVTFTSHGSPTLTMTADGCERVTLVGLGDRWASEKFWQTLASALGMSESALWAHGSRR